MNYVVNLYDLCFVLGLILLPFPLNPEFKEIKGMMTRDCVYNHSHWSLRCQIKYQPVTKLKKCSSQVKILAFVALNSFFGGICHKICSITLRRQLQNSKQRVAGSPGSTKNTVWRYYGLFITNFWPKTSNYFISVAFFLKK